MIVNVVQKPLLMTHYTNQATLIGPTKIRPNNQRLARFVITLYANQHANTLIYHIYLKGQYMIPS